jgi:hypothetical protein
MSDLLALARAKASFSLPFRSQILDPPSPDRRPLREKAASQIYFIARQNTPDDQKEANAPSWLASPSLSPD